MKKNRNNSLKREMLKRVKYALRHEIYTPEVYIWKGSWGGHGPGDFDNRGGAMDIKVGDKTLRVNIASDCDVYGEERKWARNWYTPLDRAWSSGYRRWLEKDHIAAAILACMAEALTSHEGGNIVEFDYIWELDETLESLYRKVTGHSPEFKGEKIGC